MAIIKLNATQGLTGTLPAVSGANLTNIDAGKVLQAVSTKFETETITTSTSYASTSLTASITPSATSSKVLILLGGVIYINTDQKYYFGTVYRASTDLGNSAMVITRNNGAGGGTNLSSSLLDSPNTTSATTYTYYHKVDSGATGYLSINNYTSTITLLEIGA